MVAYYGGTWKLNLFYSVLLKFSIFYFSQRKKDFKVTAFFKLYCLILLRRSAPWTLYVYPSLNRRVTVGWLQTCVFWLFFYILSLSRLPRGHEIPQIRIIWKSSHINANDSTNIVPILMLFISIKIFSLA